MRPDGLRLAGAQLPPQLSASRRVPRPLISREIGKAARGNEAPARRPAVAWIHQSCRWGGEEVL
jgi:hypothetical protein